MAYLVHHRGEPVSRDLILESLWGDIDADRAGGQFHTTVYYLRRILATVGLEGIVRHARGYYKLEMNRLHCDYDEYHQLVSASIPSQSGDIEKYEEKLEKLYRTGYMQGNDYRWAEQTRNRLEREYIRILHQIYEHYAQERNYSNAVNLLKKILTCDPLNEDIHAKLIQAYVHAGDRVSAMKQYDHLKRILDTELGIDPKESVTQLINLL